VKEHSFKKQIINELVCIVMQLKSTLCTWHPVTPSNEMKDMPASAQFQRTTTH